jgi:transcription elongation factor GreB
MAQPNYLTPEGARKLSEELRHLLHVERPKVVQEVSEAAAQGDRSENAEYIYGKKRLREIDRRVRFLTKRLESAVVVKPEEQAGDVVRFGATVEVEDEEGQRRTYLLVGPDESDPAQGKLSFKSPIGRSLLKRRVGDVVVVQRPAGEIELEIKSVSYQ